MYRFAKESKNNGLLIHRNQKDMMDYYLRLADGFPISSIIHGLWQGDLEGRKQVMGMLGHRILMAFQDTAEANADVIEIKHAGTVTAVLNMVEETRIAGHKVIIANDFIDTEESFVADLAAAVHADYVKCGAPCRGECTAKYNELLRIEEFYYNRRQSMG
jgi:enolase